MMKKVLSIFLAFSLVIQPAYGAVAPLKKAKEKFSAMKEAMKRGATILKANSQCLLLGKGKDCTPGKRGALRVIRDFTLGRFKAARDGVKWVIQANLGCFVSVFTFLGIPVIATVGSVEAGIRALAASKEKMAKFQEVWSRWTQRMEKGMQGGRLMPKFIEETASSDFSVLVSLQCMSVLLFEIVIITMVTLGIYELTPAGRRSSRKDRVRDNVRSDLYETMKEKMTTSTADIPPNRVIEAFEKIFNEKKRLWPTIYTTFLRQHGLTGPEWDDEKLDIKTFDALGISDISQVGASGKTLISLALMPDLELFPFGKYDRKRLKLIQLLKGKGVRAGYEERDKLYYFQIGANAIEETQKKSHKPIDQRLLDQFGDNAVLARKMQEAIRHADD